jgi:hypothetical protein
MKANLLTWFYSFGLVSGICLMGAEGETFIQTATGGMAGLFCVLVFGILLAGDLDKHGRG